MMKIVNQNQKEAKTRNVLTDCLWCSAPLEPETDVRGLVCRKCYNLMLNAGLKEAEIFQQKEKKSKAA